MKIIRTVSSVILALAIFSLAIGSDAQASVGGQDQDEDVGHAQTARLALQGDAEEEQQREVGQGAAQGDLEGRRLGQQDRGKVDVHAVSPSCWALE